MASFFHLQAWRPSVRSPLYFRVAGRKIVVVKEPAPLLRSGACRNSPRSHGAATGPPLQIFLISASSRVRVLCSNPARSLDGSALKDWVAALAVDDAAIGGSGVPDACSFFCAHACVASHGKFLLHAIHVNLHTAPALPEPLVGDEYMACPHAGLQDRLALVLTFRASSGHLLTMCTEAPGPTETKSQPRVVILFIHARDLDAARKTPPVAARLDPGRRS